MHGNHVYDAGMSERTGIVDSDLNPNICFIDNRAN